MKRYTLALIAVILAFNTQAQSDEEAVKKTITDYYWNVMYTNDERKEISSMTGGFHEKFNMYVYYKGELSVRTREGWMERLQKNRDKAKANPSDKPKTVNKLEFGFVDVTGQTAVAKLIITTDGKPKYTDYMSLYKIDGEWKIIAKLFSFHQL